MSLSNSPLGKASMVVMDYDPTLLFPIPRHTARQALGIVEPLPFWGMDIWNAYELSWLNAQGKPEVAVATLTVPAQSPYLIESKSLKLYLNGFSQTRLDSVDALQQIICHDLSQVCGAAVELQLFTQSAWARPAPPHSVLVQQALNGVSVDALEVEISVYEPTPSLLRVDHKRAPVEETLTSDLFKSTCPVTHQPDWASVSIYYRGAPIDHASVLQYLVSYRLHAGFHEQCVEQIFRDVWQVCQPVELSVYARFTRRGGLDINPFRSNAKRPVPGCGRTMRQ